MSIEAIKNLQKSILEYDREGAANWAKKAVEEKTDPIKAVESMTATTTAQEQMKVIETLKKEGLRGKLKIMVGGGAITQEFADSIGADGYNPTAPGAAKLARKLVGE